MQLREGCCRLQRLTHREEKYANGMNIKRKVNWGDLSALTKELPGIVLPCVGEEKGVKERFL